MTIKAGRISSILSVLAAVSLIGCATPPFDRVTSQGASGSRSRPTPPVSTATPACRLSYADNPSVTYSINPNVTYKWNPDVTYSINPNVTYSINPNVTYRFNPNVTYSINPNVTTSLNPLYGSWRGFNVCTLDGKLIGASVIANDEVMVIFTGGDWIGHFVTNKKGGYNFFNRDIEWMGFLVPTSSGGFAFFNREKDWVLSLIQ